MEGFKSVADFEAEGMTTSDAQGCYDVQEAKYKGITLKELCAQRIAYAKEVIEIEKYCNKKTNK